MRPTPLKSTAVAMLLAMAMASLPARAEPVAEISRSPVLQASPTLAAMVSDFGKARRAASTPLAAETPAETPAAPAEPPPKKSHKKTWIIVGVVLGVVAIVALASGGDDGGGGGY